MIGVDVLVFVSWLVVELVCVYLNVDELFDKVVKKFDIYGGKNEVKKLSVKFIIFYDYWICWWWFGLIKIVEGCLDFEVLNE